MEIVGIALVAIRPKLRILACLLLFGMMIVKASAQQCPVLVTKVWPSSALTMSQWGASVDDPWHRYLSMEYLNISGRTIEALAFAVSYSDILTPDQSEFTGYRDEQTLKQGKKHRSSWANGVYTRNLDKGVTARVRITKVVYADGAQWNPPPNFCETSWTAQ